MNNSRQVEVHFINTGFPYTATQSLMDFFEGLSYTQADTFLTEALQHQGYPYWSMIPANSYKYGFSGSLGNYYYNYSNLYELNDYTPRLEGGRRIWENPLPLSNMEFPQIVSDGPRRDEASAALNTEECIQANNSTSSPQRYVWQDNVNPDIMTYEELLDLGETVGTQSRGLTQERISSLPITKYKCSFFSRKKRSERCVICQMNYRRGDRQMTLPCKHVYHSGCISRWLGINKACPVCFAEVPTDEPRK